MPKLVITDSDGVREIPLNGEIKAGRLSDNQIQLKVPEASRHHCRFLQEKASWFVEDLGSSNGTLVNGRKVGKFELQDGDVISVGAMTMRFFESEAVAESANDKSWGDDDLSLDQEVFLVLGAPGRIGEVFKLKGDKVTVGRKSKNSLVLTEPSISGEHSEIVRKGESWVVRDLGSSNGTHVDGARVTEAPLASGALVVFGSVPATFGIGDPKDFSPPVVTETAEGDAATTEMISTGSFAEAPTFELHDVPRKSGMLGNVVALVLIAALGGGFAWVVINRGDVNSTTGGGNRAHQSDNKVPEKFWSFEQIRNDQNAGAEPVNGEEPSGWRKDDPLDPASTGDVGDPVYSGDQAYSISRREAGTPPTWVVLSGGPDTDLDVTPGAGYKLSVMAQATGGDVTPGVAVVWLEIRPGEEPRVVGREVVGSDAGRDWAKIEGFVVAPDGCNRAHPALVAGGAGEATFDDVKFEPSPAPVERAFETKSFKVWLNAQGALRLLRFTRAVIDGLGVWKLSKTPADGPMRAPWEVLSHPAGASGGEVSGTIRGTPATLKVALEQQPAGFKATWRFGGPTEAHAIVIPLGTGTADLNVTLLDGDRAKRMRAAFGPTPASGVIIGQQGDRVRIRFQEENGQPFMPAISVIENGQQAALKVDRGDRNVVVFAFELSFETEQKAAQELLAQARDAASPRQARDGEAIRKFEEILARYPFEEQVEKEASQGMERVLNDGRAKVRALAARVDDAKFFRTARTDDALEKDLEQEVARYSGTVLETELKAHLESLRTERTKTAGEKNEAEAKAAFVRATDYLANKNGRKEVGITFLEMVAKQYPGTEWAEQSQALLEQFQQASQNRKKPSDGEKPLDSKPVEKKQ